MQQQRDRRAEERSHLVRFLESLPDPPQGDRHFDDKPDLIIVTPRHRLGIEHRQLFDVDQSVGRTFPKEAESLESHCVTRAQTLFEHEDGRNLLVYVYFNAKRLLKTDVEPIAERLAEIVCEVAPTEPGSECRIKARRYNHTASVCIPPQIEGLWIVNPPSLGESLWSVPRSGVVPMLTPERLQSDIDTKNPKVPEYRKVSDELWLLLVADGFSPATDLRLPDDFGSDRFVSDFDRVFYFHNFTQKVVEFALAGHPLR